MNHLVFVYGTLKKGHGNHRCLSGADFVGESNTAYKYAMYVNGLPYVTKQEKISQIQGEVYCVDEDGLARLDSLEGHPVFYCREEVPVEINGKVYQAWLYFCNRFNKNRATLAQDGDYTKELAWA
jgi:gamma-glutamylcyclotransferase (GGCT)/AIG2-like uncharacterized protein YtfP